MCWKTGIVQQIASSVTTETRVNKGVFHSETKTRSETTYTFVVKTTDGHTFALADTASREHLLPLLEVGDKITFSRSRRSYGTMFAQLTIDFSFRGTPENLAFKR